MIEQVETHNKLNGYLFSMIEFGFSATAALLIAVLFFIQGSWVLALCFSGISLNCLVVTAFGFRSVRKKQVGDQVFGYFKKSRRDQIGKEHPGLLRDTLLIMITTLLPFVLLSLTILDWRRIKQNKSQ